jgi:hypothetical protein
VHSYGLTADCDADRCSVNGRDPVDEVVSDIGAADDVRSVYEPPKNRTAIEAQQTA